MGEPQQWVIYFGNAEEVYPSCAGIEFSRVGTRSALRLRVTQIEVR